jgi:hypothetical protein
MVSDHALFSPSGAHRWIACPASLAAEQGYPDTSSAYADEGTMAHAVAEATLRGEPAPAHTLDEDGLEAVMRYVDYVRDVAEGGQLMVEERVYFGDAIGQPNDLAFGTADALVARGNELVVIDLKFGRGVKVDATENKQLMLYALGALPLFDLAYEIDSVRLVVHQPRLYSVSEWTTTVSALREFASYAEAAAETARMLRDNGEADERNWLFSPTEDTCRWCKAKADCPALADAVRGAVASSFDDMTPEAVSVGTRNVEALYSDALGAKMAVVGMVEDWCKAIRARVESELFAGRAVTGYKLVEGRRGARAWTSAEVAEAMLKGFRLRVEDMYDLKLISPTTAEKLVKKNVIGPRQAAKLTEIITQSPGRPSVAPETDNRPAYSVADGFDDLTEQSTTHPFRGD